jgi:hypothetical protein
MIDLLIHKEKVNCNNYTIRRETYEGQSHIVIPVVMMIEGVHAGSRGPLLHTVEELGRFPESWNGVPVTIQHPQKDGEFVSANSPEIIAQYGVGRIFNAHMEANKLKAEAWINENRITTISPEAFRYIQNKEPLDVSTGAFVEEVDSQGQYNNEQYVAIATNLRPDHLALLPGGTGACSWTDGCGIRVNEKGGTMTEEGKKIELPNSIIINKGDKKIEISMKELVNQNLSIFPITNEVGFIEIRQLIQRKLDSMDTDTRIHYLRELFSDFFIYEVTIRNAEVDGPLLYRRSYMVQEDGGVEFTGEPQRVKKEVNYIIVNNKLIRTTKKGGKQMAEEKKPCCPDKVDALIANKATKWAEGDKEWLLTQTEEVIDKFFPLETKEEEAPVTQSKKEEKIEVNEEKKPKTTDEYLESLPKDVRESVQTGLRLNAEKRSNLIKTILDNSNEGVWSEEDLKKQDTSMLEKLAKSVSKVDYSGMAAHTEIEMVDNDQEDKLLPNFPSERKEAK